MLSLNEQLDEKVLQIFDALEELYKVQETLEQVMRDGFFNMSRARYSMGLKRVSADQILEAEMQASKTVLVSEETSGEIVASPKNLSSYQDRVVDAAPASPFFMLHKALNSTETLSDSEISHRQMQGSMDSGTDLRKRHLKDLDKLNLNDDGDNDSKTLNKAGGEEKKYEHAVSSKSDKEKIENDAHAESRDKSKPPKVFNPLNLFGILVPRELRVSQQKFEEAVDLSVQVSNLKHRLQLLQIQYKKLKRAEA
ncbi:coiled-coil domain-containing protein 115-like [Elysia marginata]|uniref:Vacuolar ATPase assembly protein VMA22 n=1 Tax=Elysia marginata TaxID=1093978 RepID=A0AAV4J9V3_9GAST|nr:coiled-coil domain-containing protein 115-like [Elysia marginata]